MATRLQIKRSTVSGITPTTGDIVIGELAINLADRKLFTSNGTSVYELGSNLTNLSVTGNTTLTGVIANGSLGTAGQTLHSNGSVVYWDTDNQGVTSVATGNGLTGGPITATGTVSVLANSGIIANTTGVYVRANNGITVNATGVYVTQGTGAVVNTTGVHVNTAFIGTLTANNTNNLNGQPASFYTNATNITSGTLATARLPATANIATAINVGANINLTTTQINVGNSTINVTINSTSISVTSDPLVQQSDIGTDPNQIPLNQYLGALAYQSNTIAVADTLTIGNAAVFVANGFVGLGTASPLYRLDVVGTTATGSGLRVLDSDGGAAQIILTEGGNTGQLAESGGTLFLTNFANGGVSISQANSNPIRFFTNSINRMIISGNGNIGIGNTTPTHALRVEGGLSLSGTIAVGNTTVNTSVNSTSISTNDIITSSINSGPLAGFRNAIINGNFDFWQRGTSFTATGYGSDRWFHWRSGTTHTVTREAFTLGQTDVPGEPTYWCRTVVSSVTGVNNFAILLQRIEDVRTFAGQQITVSFYAKADATKNIAVELSQDFGTGGSPSTPVLVLGVTKVSISTSWQKVTVTTTLPSISGKTLGTNDNSSLALFIWFDAGSTFNIETDSLGQQSGTFDIAQVQLEAGPVATPFERRSIGTELALCQRYYFGTGAQFNSAHYAAGGGVAGYHWYSLPVVMRIAPTVTASWASLVNATAGTFRMADAKTVETFIASSMIGGFTGVVTYSAFSAEF